MEIKITPSEIKDPDKNTRPMTEAELEVKRLEYELKNRLVNVAESVLGTIVGQLSARRADKKGP